MKTCIIAIARQENLYVKEWVNYHLNLGFDNIIICDNNDTDERISDVIKDDRVIILDYTDIENIQRKAYTETFIKYKNNYDWILFIDIDEFVMIDKKYNNIKEFLQDQIFIKADIIRLCWKIYTSNTDLDVINENYSVLTRFNDIYISGEEKYVKSFIRGNIEYNNGFIGGHGYYRNKNLLAVDSEGNPCNNIFDMIKLLPDEMPIYTNAWINHYPTKTIGEYIKQKYFRGGANGNCKRYRLKYFFLYNIKTPEKEEYAKKLIKELSKTMIKKKYSKLYIDLPH